MEANTTTSIYNNGTAFDADNCTYVTAEPTPHYLSSVSRTVDLVVSPVMLLVGIPGNILTMTVILAQRRTMTSTAVFLFMLAVTDTVFLMFGTFLDWLNTVSGFNMRETNSAICKTCAFLYYGSAQISSWILVAITIERILSLAVPHKFRLVCTRTTSTMSGTIICAVIIVTNVHFFYGYGISDTFVETYGSRCGPLDNLQNYITFYFYIWPWIDFTVLFAIPFIVLTFGNSYILMRISRMGVIRKGSATNRTMDNKRRLRSITILIFCLNAIFLICVTPFSVFMTLEKYVYDWADEAMCRDPVEHGYRRGVIEVIMSCFICLTYLNPTINFVLYVLSGTEFRKAVFTLLSCKRVNSERAF